MRADFNGDGIEDILIFEGVHATQGSFRFYQIIILTRKSMKGKFEVVEPEIDGVQLKAVANIHLLMVHGISAMNNKENQFPQFGLCLNNEGYPASLGGGKIVSCDS